MTSNVQISEAPTAGLGRLILENRFFVPTHQRDYKWDRERVQKFFDDLTEAMDREDRFYFVGLMVFMRADDGRLRVLDGQQRLATTIILFSALRTWFGAADPGGPDAAKIQSDFIGRADYGETRAEPKMSLNLNNDVFFQRHVISGGQITAAKADLKSEGRRSPSAPLLAAIIYLHQRISETAQGLGDQERAKEYFARLIRFMRDAVVAVRLTVPNESNAFRVFETLNDRGMDLSAFDLLKNFLFGLAFERSGKSLQQLEHRWSQLIQTLQDENEDDFLKVYWTSRHGLTQLHDVYDAVKAETKIGEEAEDLSIDMLEAAESYAALEDPDDPVWAPHTAGTRELIAGLKVLGSKLARPVILSGMQKLDPPELEKLLRVLEVIVVRWQVIGEGRTGTIERQFAKLAEQIWSGTAKRRTDFVGVLNELYTTDEDFRTKFSQKEGLSNKKAAYLLRRLEIHERALKGKTGKELMPSADLTVEHIFPSNHSNDWAAEVASDKRLPDSADRLGNLCLLTGTANKEASRYGFDKKLKIFRESELITTREVAEHSKWNVDSISTRQVWLAARALAVWKI